MLIFIPDLLLHVVLPPKNREEEMVCRYLNGTKKRQKKAEVVV